MKTLLIYELQILLGYSDNRSVRDWCIQENVLIVKRGKNEMVFECEFKLAYELPFINKLKNKFGDGWDQVYNLYKDGNIPALHVLNDVSSKPVSFYKPNSERENKYSKKLDEYERKKKNAA